MLNHVPRNALIENHRNAALDLAWLDFTEPISEWFILPHQ